MDDFIRNDRYLAAAKDLSQIDFNGIRLGTVTRNLVQLGHKRVEWIFIDQRDFHVVALAKYLMQGFARFYTRVTPTDDEYFCFHIFPSPLPN
ncbi:hypothetical protein SDC9_98560 [bioreactor metagenome]|uniref:Uncharacterized protein n=1 Tax=bioreactor metagenome TaxID=1076179 RepID=A0A645AF60_9ZZZZ